MPSLMFPRLQIVVSYSPAYDRRPLIRLSVVLAKLASKCASSPRFPPSNNRKDHQHAIRGSGFGPPPGVCGGNAAGAPCRMVSEKSAAVTGAANPMPTARPMGDPSPAKIMCPPDIFAGLGSPIGRAVGMGFAAPVTAAEMDQFEHFYHSRGAP